jgi:putative membrane protein
MFAAIQLAEVASTIFYTALGVGLMGICWLIITRLAPFSVIREIEHDQNVALAVLIGAVFLSLAIIIAAVLHSS